MEILDYIVWDNPLKTWLIATLVAVATILTLRILRGVFLRRLRSISRKTRGEFDDLITDLLDRTKGFFLLILAVFVGAFVLTLPGKATDLIRVVVLMAILVQGGLWGNAVITFAIARAMRERLADDASSATTVSALGFVGKLALWAIVVLLALDNLPGVEVGTLIAGMGISGIAIALAVQNILGDLFASLSIVLDKPFVIGDFIIVGELLGTVEHIGLKSTRVRSLSGEQLVFSNSDLLGSRIRNFKRMNERRVVFSIGVTYQTPYEKLAAIPSMLRETIEAQKETRFDRAHFQAYGDFALNFEVVYYVKTPDYNTYMDIQQTINLEIYRRFHDEGIEFAYPTQTLFLEKTEDMLVTRPS